jgi:serine/threonine protein phosphatase PrpC
MENFIYHNLTKKNFSLIKNIINSIDKDLSKENFDSKSSGSTLLLLFHISKFIICANIGDSRCILIKKNTPSENNNNSNNINNFNFENLSFDHKPNNQEEKKRIIENGGIVRQSLNYNGLYEGCYRIYMKEKNYPGLAISRTIGDFDSKLIGNISEPDIKMKVIDNNFICVVLASDGLWDVMHGNDVIKEIYPFFEKNNFEESAENLVNKAIFYWKAESFLRDDISAIIGIFNYKKK